MGATIPCCSGPDIARSTTKCTNFIHNNNSHSIKIHLIYTGFRQCMIETSRSRTSRMSLSFQLGEMCPETSCRPLQQYVAMHTSAGPSIPSIIFDDFIMLQPHIIRDLSFATRSSGRIDACTSNESIHCKQMHLKKMNQHYIVDQYLGVGVRIGWATLDDGTRTIRELFYLIIRGEN